MGDRSDTNKATDATDATIDTLVDRFFDNTGDDANRDPDDLRDDATDDAIDNDDANAVAGEPRFSDIEIDSIVKDEIIVGIDLGTTNSSVVVWRNNNYEIIPDEYGNNTIPSVVALTNRSRYIGSDAKNQSELNPKNVFYEVKRLIGRKMTDERVEQDREFLTYDIAGDEGDNIVLRTDLADSKTYTPEEVSSMILSKLKTMASDYLKHEVTKAVITVPATFNDSQRQATKDATKIAGLECIRIINEPTAAALAYGLSNRSFQKTLETGQDTNVIVYDFGGGTLDVSLLNLSGGLFEVLAVGGNTHLGGTNFDKRLLQYCLHTFKRRHGLEKLDDLSTLSLQRLRRACENAKKLLSSSDRTVIAIQDFHAQKDLYVPVTQEKFVELTRDLLLISIKPLEDVLSDSQLRKEDIDEVILVGGMTRMPAIRDNIRTFFNGKEPNHGINPDEAVGIGAAIQGYKLSHEDEPFSQSVTFLDVIALSLGVETIGGVMNTIIKRNTIIPITKSKLYMTDSDFESSVTIKIFEGERKLTRDNFLVGTFDLKGIEPQPRGLAKIEVRFNVDVNGIITVSAEDTETKARNGITITGNKGRLKEDQIQRLVREAREYELRDKVERLKKRYYYEIDDLCSNIRINVKNDTFQLSETDKRVVLEDVTKIEAWMKEKSYNSREEEEYITLLKRLRKNYGILILKTTTDSTTTVKATEVGDTASTTVYGNDEEEEESKQLYERLEDEELGVDKMTDDERKEVKQLRECLRELCGNLFDMLASQSLRISESHIMELKESIDDVLLWMHVHTKATKAEYKMKIEEVNTQCDTIMGHYNKDEKNIFTYDEIVSSIRTARDELEQLCLLVKSCLSTHLLGLREPDEVSLTKRVDSELEWLVSNPSATEAEYKRRTEELNDLCNTLHSNLNGVHPNRVTDILGGDRGVVAGTDSGSSTDIPITEVPTVDDDLGGTSVAEIIRRRNQAG